LDLRLSKLREQEKEKIGHLKNVMLARIPARAGVTTPMNPAGEE